MRFQLLAVPLSLAILCACGGGKVDPDSSAGVAFTSFSSTQPGQTVNATGSAQTQSITQDSSGFVTAQTINPPDRNGANGLLTYASTAPLTLKGIQFVTPRSNVSWLEGRGNEHVTCASSACSASGGGATGVLFNPTGGFLGDFQFFGYWFSVTGSSANLIGSISAGRLTPISSIPITGSVLAYNGQSGGIYVSPAGEVQEHGASMAVTFNPAGPTLTFSTVGTGVRTWNASGPFNSAALDINGQVTYVAGTGQFSGPVTIGPTGSPNMTGTINGVFYGPNTDEIGGTFSLTSNFGPIETIIGSFGGVR